LHSQNKSLWHILWPHEGSWLVKLSKWFLTTYFSCNQINFWKGWYNVGSLFSRVTTLPLKAFNLEMKRKSYEPPKWHDSWHANFGIGLGVTWKKKSFWSNICVKL
jgi:hypothetical protein